MKWILQNVLLFTTIRRDPGTRHLNDLTLTKQNETKQHKTKQNNNNKKKTKQNKTKKQNKTNKQTNKK